jgi:hypothetical protein
MLKDTVIPTIQEVAGDLVADLNRSDMVVRFRDEKELLLRSADEPDKLRGPNLGFFWLDEAAQMAELVFDIMVGRIRLQPGRGWLTTTPCGRNWIYRLFVAKKDVDYELIESSTRANVFLPKFYIESLDKKYHGLWHEQEVEGKFVEWVDEPAYSSFSRQKNTEKGVFERYRPDRPLKIGCDFNVRLMCWPVLQEIPGGVGPRVLCEIYSDGRAQTRDMVKLFRKEFPAHLGGIEIYGDATAGRTYTTASESDYDQILSEFKSYPSPVMLMVPSKNPPPKDRINAVNDAFSGVGRPWILKMDADRCPVLIQDLERVELNEFGNDVKKVKDWTDEAAKLTHASDALGYLVHMEYPVGADDLASQSDGEEESRSGVRLAKAAANRRPRDERGLCP